MTVDDINLPGPGEVQVWHMEALCLLRAGVLEQAYALLSDAEQTRAARLLREEARAEFLCGRAALRLLLARATGLAPRELDLQVGVQGKPFLYGVNGAPEFNLSHSGGEVLLALSTDGPVGIDLECDRRHVAGGSAAKGELLDIAAAVFGPVERSWLEAAPEGARRNARFLALWTAREAVMKAVGCGLVAPPRFSVAEALSGKQSEALLVEFVEARPSLRIHLYPLALGTGRTAALASAQPVSRIQMVNRSPFLPC